MVSLHEILAKIDQADRERTYQLLQQDERQEEAAGDECSKTVIVKRQSLSLNDQDCEMFSFIDITNFIKLKQKIEKIELLKNLNTQVSHEMLGPL